MKDHEIAALVNTLRDIAIKYHGSQQLREQIAAVVVPALQRAALPSLRTSQVTALKAYRDEMRDACSYFQDTHDVEERLTAILESVSPHPPRTLTDAECEAIGIEFGPTRLAVNYTTLGRRMVDRVTAALQQSSSRITAGAEKPSQVVDSGAAGPTRTGDLLITNQGAETAETLGNQQDTPSAAPVDGAQAAQGESSTCEGVTAGHGTRIEVNQSQRMAELRAEAAKWERLHDELYAEIASEHRRDEYGETETAAECVRRIIRERDELEREKLKRESQEPVAFRWLGPGKGWLPVYAEPPVPRVDPDGAGADFVGWLGPRGIFMEDEIYQAWKEYRKDPSAAQYRKIYAAPPPPHVDPDWLANFIRTVDGGHTMGAGALAEKIAEAINGRTP